MRFRFTTGRVRRGHEWSPAWPALVLTCLTAFPSDGGSAQVPTGAPPGVERDPEAARVVVDDVVRFAEAWRRLPAVVDTVAFLDTAYLAAASVGLHTYAGMYDVDARSMTRALERDPEAFRIAALRGPVSLDQLEKPLRRAFHRLAERYPPALFPRTYFLVGRNHAGGAVQPEGILVAVESYARPDGSRELQDLLHLAVHELVHFQQAAYDVALYQRSNTLVARAIREGVADYVAELLTGDHINATAHAYGNAHEWQTWSRFRCELDRTEPGDWLFSRPADPAWPQDLGYYVGYRIAALRYAREYDPGEALRALLQVDDYRAFLETSGYEDHVERREGRPFPECPDAGSAP